MADTEKKTGTYICTGCGIGDSLDIAALEKVATAECKVALCKTHPCLCGEEGLGLIRKDIAEESLTSVVLGACSFRAKQKEFGSIKGVNVERANLREGVTWVLEAKDEDTQWLAEDYIRIYCEKAKRSTLPDPFQEDGFSKKIMVVGAGPAGLTAALETAKAGYEVVLLEKESTLGGYGSKIHRSFPTVPPYRELEVSTIGSLVDAVESHDRIGVYKNAEIVKTSGAPCKFDVELKAGDKEVTTKVGAIVLATGSDPYDASKLGHLGYGQHKDVVTNVEFEAMAKEEKLLRPSDGQPVKNVLFVQCAGSRDSEHLSYCSSHCCKTALKQATYVHQSSTDAQTYILYKDIRTPGQAEEFYRQVQQDGTVFIRGELKEVSQPNGKLSVAAENLLLGEDVVIEDLDLVVLATGLVPTSKMEGEGIEPLEGEDLMKPSILKLEYRQGPEIPNLRYGYPDSHFICFPYETRRTGIYAAGTVRRAMDAAAAQKDAMGAALKAIQCVEMAGRGEAVHPRAGDKTYPEFFMQRCTQCKRCTEECPFGAINEDAEFNPLLNPTRCRRCGVCMGACPERIVSFKDYAVDMYSAMIKTIEVPDEDEEKPCVLCMVCENDAWPVLDQLAQQRKKLNPYIRVLPLRCLGGVNLVWVADALSKGIDGILFFGCKHGDDYQCHFVKGSELCATRLTKVQDTLDRLVLEADRVRFEQIAMTDGDKMMQVIEEFMETIEDVGPNPYKGF